MLASLAVSLLCALPTAEQPIELRGETPPPGPPWLLSYREARRDALLHGRPVFVYFTKTH